MDFIFGTFATDELKVVHHRAARRGLQHQFELTPRDPLPDQPIVLTVQIGTDMRADHVVCYYTLDGTPPAGECGTATNGTAILLHRVETVWDAVAWGYVTRWQGTLPGQPNGTVVRYCIGAWQNDAPEVFADWPDVTRTAEHAAAAFFRGDELPTQPIGDPADAHVFCLHVDRLTPPKWAYHTPIYQVFVDRFYPGDGHEWNQPDRLDGFYGGTLWGVREKLDYIQALGAGCIWLSPTWESRSHHGYDVEDHYTTSDRLGGDDALYELVQSAHERGIRVLLDLPCNHLSNEHVIFTEALHNPNSVYRDWFYFDDSEIGYRSFFGVPTLPQINVSHPAARDWLLNVARYWIKTFDVDGYRLDYANGPGPDFWADFRAACKSAKADSFCFGEIVDQPAALLPYVGRLDGSLDFHVGEALRKTYAYGVWSEADLARFVERHNAYFDGVGDFVRPTFLDNHDMDRFLYAAQGDQAALRRAAAAQMQMAQPPIVYYGTEVGLSQQRSKDDGWGLEVSREPMPWGDAQDADLLAFYRAQIANWRSAHS